MKHLTRIFFLWVMLITIKLIDCYNPYSDDEFEVIENLGMGLSVKNYAFVENGIQTKMKIVRQLKVLSGSSLYSTVVSTEQLEKILDHESATKYFQRKTLIVTKEILNFTGLLQKVSGPTLLYWLVFTDTMDAFETFYIPANADVLVAYSTFEAVVVHKVYHIKPGRKLSVKNVAVLVKFENKSFAPPSLYSESIDYINFENVSLSTLMLLNKDSCKLTDTMQALDKMECFHQEMIDIMAQKLNFSINMIECPEKRHPYNYPNGSLSELFLMLLRREVDLSSASYVISKNRLKFYDFAWPTFTAKSMMYIKFSTNSAHWQAYLGPMDRYLWYAIVLWIITAGLVLQIFHNLRSRNFAPHFSLISESFKSILETLQMFCTQGVDNMPQWNSNRLVYTMTFLLVLIVYQVYSGHLISSLTVAIPYVPFVDLEGFFRDGTFKLMTLKSGFHHFYFKKIIDQMGASHLLLSSKELPIRSNEGVVKLCSDDHLVFVEFRENIVNDELPCKIVEIARPIFYQSIGIGFPKDSPYQEFIKRELTLFHSSGILQRMRTNLFSYVTIEEKDTSNEDFEAVTIKQVSSIFVLLWIGIVIACIIFLIEFFYFKIVSRLHKKRAQRLSKADKRRIRLKMILNWPLIKY